MLKALIRLKRRPAPMRRPRKSGLWGAAVRRDQDQMRRLELEAFRARGWR